MSFSPRFWVCKAVAYILELHEMIRVPHVLACPIDFNLLCDRVQQEGVLRRTQNDHFLVFLAVFVLFPKFLGRLRNDLRSN